MKRILVLILILPVFLCGCWDQKIFEQIGFMLNLGIESSADGELLVTYTSPVIAEGKKANEVELIATTGSILREARVGARRRSAKLLEAGKIQQILISSELAKKRGVHELIEVLERDPTDPVQAWVIIVDGSPNEMLTNMIKFKDKPRPSIYLNQLMNDCIKSSYIPETKVFDFDINYFAPGIDPMTPMVKYSDKEIQATGSALFSGDKMVGKIDHKQTFLLQSMKGFAKRTEYTSINPKPRGTLQEGKEMATTLKGNKSKIEVKIQDNKPVINISLSYEGYLNEYKWDNLSSETEQRKIEESLEDDIKRDCEEVVKYTQEVGSDPLGIGDMVRAKYSNYWKSVNWMDIYKNAVFNIDVKLNIKQYGAID